VNVLPLHAEAKKVAAAESQNLYKLLVKHGISEKAAQNIIKFYEEG
jgi:hypothetical protein